MIRPLALASLVLRPLPAGDNTPPSSDLLLQGRAVPQPLAGKVLEAAFECDGRVLVFMSDDVPYEDALHLHLLDAQGALLDTATLGAMYSTGSFALIGVEPPRSVRFRFFGDTDWRVELLDSAVARVPFLGEPRGVHRPFGFTRHFKVHGEPQPERAA